MTVPEPYTAIALSAGVLTNLASDILKHRSQYVENPLMVRALKWTGFRELDIEEDIQGALIKALQLYFEQHPEYKINGIISFISDPVTARQIADYVLDGQSIDEKALQRVLDTYLNQQTVARLLIKKRNLKTTNIVPDLLTCYRRVLNQQLSVPQMALMLQFLEQKEQALEAIKASEERLKSYIQEVLETTLTPETLQAHYRAGQQELAEELLEEITDADMLQIDVAEQTIAARLRPLPALFSEGLCKGRPLKPAPNHYFVSHGFDPETLQDWRETLVETLAHAADATEPLRPYFAGDTILAGFKLCGISEKICATRFSTFLLPPSQDRNVYLELGIAIGLGVPLFLIQHFEAKIPSILEGLARYTRGGLFRRMRRELAGQVEEYDFGVVRFVNPQAVTKESVYLLAAGGLGMEDEDFESSVREALAADYPQLQIVSLNENVDSGWMLEQLVETIQSSRFAIYRVDEHCSPTTFLALGISIGANRPFLMVHHSRSHVPENLRGIGIHQFNSYVGLEQQFLVSCRAFLDKHSSTSPANSVQDSLKLDSGVFSRGP